MILFYCGPTFYDMRKDPVSRNSSIVCAAGATSETGNSKEDFLPRLPSLSLSLSTLRYLPCSLKRAPGQGERRMGKHSSRESAPPR